MGSYVSVAQVEARIPYLTITGSTKPSDKHVGEWIEEAEALLNAALSGGAGITTPVTSTDAITLMRMWVLDYAVGHTLEARANTGADGSNDDGVSHLERFFAREADMHKDPGKYAQLLAGGTGPASSRRVRSHVTDNADGKSTGAGDFAPKFTRDDYN